MRLNLSHYAVTMQEWVSGEGELEIDWSVDESLIDMDPCGGQITLKMGIVLFRIIKQAEAVFFGGGIMSMDTLQENHTLP